MVSRRADILYYRNERGRNAAPPMPCPHFLPSHPLDRPVGHRVPLGKLWAGSCDAGGSPDEDTVASRCNAGYARRRCPWFPPLTEADAVRFSPSARGDLFILERAGAPFAYGPLADIAPGTTLARQAQAWKST